MRKLKDNGGFSLVEMMVAMVILGIITVPVLSGMLVSIKAMNYSEQMMKSQLAVSSAVETLMAQGVTGESENYRLEDFPDVTVKTVRAKDATGNDLPYYNVTVTSTNGSFAVETVIREGGGGA